MTEKTLSKWDQAVSKLVQLTQDGNLKWKPVRSSPYLGEQDTEGVVLIVQYEKRQLLLYRKSYMRVTVSMQNVFPADVKDYRAELSIYDGTAGSVLYSFPYSALVEDLYKAATFQAAGVDELINSLVNVKEDGENRVG